MSLPYNAAAPTPGRATTDLLPKGRFSLLGNMTGFEVRGATLVLDCGGPRLAVTFLADDVARVRLAPDGTFRTDKTAADAHETPFSYATADEHDWEYGTLEVRDLGDRLRIQTSALVLNVRKAPCRLCFTLPDGRPLLNDTAGHGWALTDDGRTETRCWKALPPDGRFFGLGDKTFELDRRGRRLTFWNSDTYAYGPGQDPIYKSVPFLLGLHPAPPSINEPDETWTGYGLFHDNTHRSYMDLGAPAENGAPAEDWWFGAEDGELRYVVFSGPDLKRPLRRYADLTGHIPLPPRWSLGYHQSRWNYHDEGYARWIAHEFRRRDLPLECVHLDIGHMNGFRVFTWDRDSFPNPKRLHEHLTELGVRSVVIVDPGVKIDEDYDVYTEGRRWGLYCNNLDGSPFTDTVWPGEVHWPDFSKPEARSWWSQLHQRYLDDGVTGFWNDMNEPAILGGRDFPDEVEFAYGDRDTGPTTHREAHNVYGLLMARATYEGLREVRPQERPFLLTRACFSGSQRYAAAWTGDNVSTWDHLLLSLRICQSLSASALAFCGSDIGGFAGQPTGELYARWMQAGVVTPFMRTHYSHEETDQQEPWAFGDEIEHACRTALRLRYRLLPYLYTVFEACTRTAAPVMRAMVLEHPGDPETHHGHDDQFYVGDALLAAPVVEDGARNRNVYFPAVEGGWTNFASGHFATKGGETISVEAPLDHLPLFIRAGRVVPLHPHMLYSEDVKPEALTLRLAPGSGRSEVYLDDGLSFSHEEGDWRRLYITQSHLPERLSIHLAHEGRRAFPYERFEWEIAAHGIPEAPTVSTDDRKIPLLSSLDAFDDVEEGAVFDSGWLRIRTRADVSRLILS